MNRKSDLFSTVPAWVLLHWIHRMSIPFHPKPKRRGRTIRNHSCQLRSGYD
jgi:hypothetical protein